MRVLVVGSTYGDLDLYNKYVEQTECDVVLSTGNIGIFYERDKRPFNTGNFHEYLNGKKSFLKPVIAVPGTSENFTLVDLIVEDRISIPNFKLLKQGQKFTFCKTPNDAIGITGLGRGFSPVSYRMDADELTGNRRKHMNYLDVMEVRKNYETNILLMHELPAEYTNKQINFTDDCISMLNDTFAVYAFFGKYEKWFCNKYRKASNRNIALCSLPKFGDGYAILDTNTWNLNGINILQEGEDESQ